MLNKLDKTLKKDFKKAKNIVSPVISKTEDDLKKVKNQIQPTLSKAGDDIKSVAKTTGRHITDVAGDAARVAEDSIDISPLGLGYHFLTGKPNQGIADVKTVTDKVVSKAAQLPGVQSIGGVFSDVETAGKVILGLGLLGAGYLMYEAYQHRDTLQYHARSASQYAYSGAKTAGYYGARIGLAVATDGVSEVARVGASAAVPESVPDLGHDYPDFDEYMHPEFLPSTSVPERLMDSDWVPSSSTPESFNMDYE